MNTVYAAAGRDEKSHELVLQLANQLAESRSVNIQLQGYNGQGATAKVVTLANNNPEIENTLDAPDAISPGKSDLPGIKPSFVAELPPNSVQILRIPLLDH